jgi:hypothetical protein
VPGSPACMRNNAGEFRWTIIVGIAIFGGGGGGGVWLVVC